MSFSFDSISFNLVKAPAQSINPGDGSTKLRLVLSGFDSEIAKISACILSREDSLAILKRSPNWLLCCKLKDKFVFLSIRSIVKRLKLTPESVCQAASENNLLKFIAQESGYFFQQSAKRVSMVSLDLGKITDYILSKKPYLIHEPLDQEAMQGCLRRVQVLSDGLVVHFTKTLCKIDKLGHGDLCLGRGSDKKVRCRVWFNGPNAGRIDALGSVSPDIYQKYRKSILCEVECMKRLTGKPGIITFYDSSEIKSRRGQKLFIGMEWNNALDLHVVAKKYILPELYQICFALDLLRALKSMKEEKILHRDLKPANILIVNHKITTEAIICDLGHACFDDDEERKQHHCGTEGFRSPELQAASRKESPFEIAKATNYARDIYALGATLYYMKHRKRVPREMTLVSPKCVIMEDILEHLIFETLQSKPEDRITLECALGKYAPLIIQRADDLGYIYPHSI